MSDDCLKPFFVESISSPQKTKKMRKWLIAVIIIATSWMIKAQNQTDKICGTIADKQNQPIVMANVVALDPTDSAFINGTTSEADGSFNLIVPAYKKRIVQISYVGYETRIIENATGNIGKIILEDHIQLEEATVTATRPVYHLKGSTLTTDIHETILATSGSGRDVLKHIPGISVKSEGYEVFGKGTPQIYIDNHLVQDNAEINRLSSKDIQKVEVIRNPGAEYDATVKSVIRIRTTHKNDQGLSGYTQGEYMQTHYSTYDGLINLSFHKEKLTLFGNIWYSHGTDRRHQTNVYQVFSPSSPTVNSKSLFFVKGNFIGGKVGMNYDIGPKQSIGFAIEPQHTPDNVMTDNAFYTAEKKGFAKDSIQYDSRTQLPATSAIANGYYEGEFGEWKLNLTTDMLIGKNSTDQRVKENGTYSKSNDLLTQNHTKNRMVAAKLTVSRTLGKGEIKIGTDHTFIRRRDNFISSKEILPTINNKIDENKSALFTEYNSSFGKLNVSVGVRYEHAESDYWKDGTHIAEQSKSYNDLLPSLSIDFPMGEVQTTLSYTTHKSRPNFQMLRSNLNYNNRYVYEGGNPLLIPSTERSVELGMLYKWLQWSVNYTNVCNAMVSDEQAYVNDPDIGVLTVVNKPRSQSLNTFLTIAPTIISWWKPQLNVSYMQPFFKIQYGTVTKKMNRGMVGFTLNQSITFLKEYTLTVDANYQGEGDEGSIHTQSNGSLDIGLRRSFFSKKLDVILQGTDLLHTQRDYIDFYGSYMKIVKRAKSDTRSLLVTLRYNFHPSKLTYKGRHVSESDIQRLN